MANTTKCNVMNNYGSIQNLHSFIFFGGGGVLFLLRRNFHRYFVKAMKSCLQLVMHISITLTSSNRCAWVTSTISANLRNKGLPGDRDNNVFSGFLLYQLYPRQIPDNILEGWPLSDIFIVFYLYFKCISQISVNLNYFNKFINIFSINKFYLIYIYIYIFMPLMHHF